MDQFRFNKIILIVVITVTMFSGCNKIRSVKNTVKAKISALYSSLSSSKKDVREINIDDYEYKGSIRLCDHPWLKNKKIFIDPGHGGLGKSDPFRIGHKNVSEEKINLRVAVVLKTMLVKAGANVKMSRDTDCRVSLDERIKAVNDYNPDVLLSIHHNGSLRRKDNINYPAVLIWGNKSIRPASYDLAKNVLYEFNKIIKPAGRILSDYAIFAETGTRLLRKTRYICPGIIGEAGFFTNNKHALRLRDITFNEREAEAYFYALSKYFKRGIPKAEILISCPHGKVNYMQGMITTRKPMLWLKLTSGNSKPIHNRSLSIRINDMPAYFKQYSKTLYRILYGSQLYPGQHLIQVKFRNKWGQSSMLYYAKLLIEMQKGEYNYYAARGRYLIRHRRAVKTGLKMLLAIRQFGVTGPHDDRILADIALGFRYLGRWMQSRYYYARLYHFYPQSRYTPKHWKYRQHKFYRYPVDYYGKELQFKKFFIDECRKLTMCRKDSLK